MFEDRRSNHLGRHSLIAFPLTAKRARARFEALSDCGSGVGGAVLEEADPSDSVMNGIALEAREALSVMVNGLWRNFK